MKHSEKYQLRVLLDKLCQERGQDGECAGPCETCPIGQVKADLPDSPKAPPSRHAGTNRAVSAGNA